MKKLTLFVMAFMVFAIANASDARAALYDVYLEDIDGTPVANFNTSGTWTYDSSDVFGTATYDQSGLHVLPISTGAGADAEYYYIGIDSTVTYTLSQPQSTFSFYWGTVDSYNTIEITYVGGGSEYLTGDQIIAMAASGNNSASAFTISKGTDGVYVTLSTVATLIESITFINGSQNAFEIADFAATPLPGALLLFGTALVGVGAARRKKEAA